MPARSTASVANDRRLHRRSDADENEKEPFLPGVLMTAENLIELLEERPFTPLRIRLDDGRSYEVRHPGNGPIVTPR